LRHIETPIPYVFAEWHGSGDDAETPYHGGVSSVALKLFLLLAVLIQYTPLRVCAVERVALGSNCHDQDSHAVLGDAYADEQSCDYPVDGQHDCFCERPKADAQHDPVVLKSPLDWAHAAVPATVPLVAVVSDKLSLPDPHRSAPLALQLPLLI